MHEKSAFTFVCPLPHAAIHPGPEKEVISPAAITDLSRPQGLACQDLAEIPRIQCTMAVRMDFPPDMVRRKGAFQLFG
jgi:hypothetical protein